jgi:hypothetical protein
MQAGIEPCIEESIRLFQVGRITLGTLENILSCCDSLYLLRGDGGGSSLDQTGS